MVCELRTGELELGEKRDWGIILLLQAHDNLLDFCGHFGGAGPEGLLWEER